MINICVPVLKRYDLLREMLTSLQVSTVKPSAIYVIDNGRDQERLESALIESPAQVIVERPAAPMGLAESWNWFIHNVPEDRLITNDDITFAPDSLAIMQASVASFVSCTFGFSCFIIRKACIRAVGLFDETLSPGYAYFEDMDYLRRMRLAGVVDEVLHCGVSHRQSATLAKYSEKEWQEHHRKFKIAERNFKCKWASEPSWEQLAAIGGEGAHR